jgi:phosphoglycolate phosphatase
MVLAVSYNPKSLSHRLKESVLLMSKFLIAFDYDGVLADSLTHNLGVVKQVCLSMGMTRFPTSDDIKNLETVSYKDLGRQIQIPETRIEEFTSLTFKQLSQDTALLSAFKGISDLIYKLSQRHILIIVTNNLEDVVKRFLVRHGLDTYFFSILDTESLASKSKRIIHAANKYNIDKTNVYMIGDSVNDIREAKSADVKSIAVTWGFQSRRKLKNEFPDYLIDTPMELLEIIDENSS